VTPSDFVGFVPGSWLTRVTFANGDRLKWDEAGSLVITEDNQPRPCARTDRCAGRLGMEAVE
jgi:hypothetical protein